MGKMCLALGKEDTDHFIFAEVKGQLNSLGLEPAGHLKEHSSLRDMVFISTLLQTKLRRLGLLSAAAATNPETGVLSRPLPGLSRPQMGTC